MKIEFKEESNKLIITKTSFEELSKLKKKMKWGFLFLNCFSIYFFINLYLKGDKIGSIVTLILGGIICYIPISSFYNQIKYKYCEEILILSLNNIEIKYILEGKLLFSKKINYKDINKIYTKVDHRNPYLRGKTKKAENIVLSQYFEDIRSLKIKLSSNEIYTWGSEVKEEDIYQVLLNIDKYIKKFNILKAYV